MPGAPLATVWNPSSSAKGAGELGRGEAAPETREATAGGTAGAAPPEVAAAFSFSLSLHPPPPRAPGRYLAGAGLSERGGGVVSAAARAAGAATGVDRLQADASSLTEARTGGAAETVLAACLRARASSSRCC